MSAVLELMNYAAPYTGNFIPSVVSLAERLKERRMDTVFVFAQKAQTREWIEALRKAGYPIYFLPKQPFAAARLLRRICRKHQVTLVHSHFIDHTFYLPLRIACAGNGTRHVFHAHSMPRFSRKGLPLRRALLHADTLICVSDAVRKAYEALGFGPCVVVENGVAFDRLCAGDSVDVPKPLVLMFGYDFSIKGVDTALDALAQFDPSHRYTLGLCVAGHEPQARAALTERFGGVPQWVRLLPPRTDVGAYYRVSDVFLSASRTEGMPYAVIEAAYCGLPLALSDIPQHRALGLSGVQFFPPGDAKALFAAIESAKAAPQNRARAAERFSVGAWTDAVLLQLLK